MNNMDIITIIILGIMLFVVVYMIEKKVFRYLHRLNNEITTIKNILCSKGIIKQENWNYFNRYTIKNNLGVDLLTDIDKETELEFDNELKDEKIKDELNFIKTNKK